MRLGALHAGLSQPQLWNLTPPSPLGPQRPASVTHGQGPQQVCSQAMLSLSLSPASVCFGGHGISARTLGIRRVECPHQWMWGRGAAGNPSKAQAQTLPMSLRLWGQRKPWLGEGPFCSPLLPPSMGLNLSGSHCRRTKVSGVKVQLAQPHGLAGWGLWPRLLQALVTISAAARTSKPHAANQTHLCPTFLGQRSLWRAFPGTEFRGEQALQGFVALPCLDPQGPLRAAAWGFWRGILSPAHGLHGVHLQPCSRR